ncbi:MAG: DUF1269 domain-containing protein [Thermoanaerobaculia bacterium]
MERMLVVVFDNEKKAYEGKSALHQVQYDSDVTVYAEAVVVKHADGSISVKEQDDFGPVGTLIGTSLGAMLGVLGGPVGLAIGATAGLTLGGLADVDNLLVGEDFLAEVTKSLTPNKVALVAQIDETWTAPVDTRMEALGGTVFRRSLAQVRQDVEDQDVAAMKADVAQLKDEIKTANADRKAKLQKKIAGLETNIEAKQAKAKDRRKAFEARQESKKEVIKKNAKAAGQALKELANTPV